MDAWISVTYTRFTTAKTFKGGTAKRCQKNALHKRSLFMVSYSTSLAIFLVSVSFRYAPAARLGICCFRKQAAVFAVNALSSKLNQRRMQQGFFREKSTLGIMASCPLLWRSSTDWRIKPIYVEIRPCLRRTILRRNMQAFWSKLFFVHTGTKRRLPRRVSRYAMYHDIMRSAGKQDNEDPCWKGYVSDVVFTRRSAVLLSPMSLTGMELRRPFCCQGLPSAFSFSCMKPDKRKGSGCPSFFFSHLDAIKKKPWKTLWKMCYGHTGRSIGTKSVVPNPHFWEKWARGAASMWTSW